MEGSLLEFLPMVRIVTKMLFVGSFSLEHLEHSISFEHWDSLFSWDLVYFPLGGNGRGFQGSCPVPQETEFRIVERG